MLASRHTELEMVVASNAVQLLEHDGGRPRASAEPQSSVTLADLGFEALFDRLLDAVVIARLSTGRIVFWNAAAEKLFGYPASEAIGKPIEMLMPEPISHVHRAGIERYLRTGHGLIVDADAPVEMPARTRNGEEIRVELALSELAGPDEQRFAVAVIRNAMLRKQLELTTLDLTQARVARDEAEAAIAARDELLGMVAKTVERLPSAEQLDRLVTALGALRDARLGTHRGRSVDVDVVDVVHAACDAARRRAAGKRLLVHLPPSAPASCDPAQLRLVLDYVLDDLVARSERGARIELRVEQLSPQVIQLNVHTQLGAEHGRSSVTLLVSRLLMQHIGGTLHADVSARGQIEVVMTVPATRRERRAATRRRSR